MNILITKNGTDITSKVISYERNLNICSGIGTLNVVLELVSGIDFYPWDEIILYEEGVRKGTFNVGDIEKDAHLATINISCIDNAKRLIEYYVTTVYEIDYVSYARYWLELILDQAGVDYSINATGSGSVMSNNTVIGPEQAYEIVLRLLQMCGWYMYFDGNGVCQIGTLTIDTDVYDHTFVGTTQISNIDTNKNDQMLRNRAVVWGVSDPDTEQWVYADRSVNTPYNYDSQDKRASVLANSNIDSVGAASVLANKMLNEFARITHEKTITLIGAYDVTLGQTVFASTRKLSTVGMVTTITSTMSSSGLNTILILDQRCPRLFGYYGYLGYVYVGTYGNGVWRKLIEGFTWSDFSTGLTDLRIVDLYIRNGIFACVSRDGNAYYRTLNHTAWQPITKPTVTYTDEFDEVVEVEPDDINIVGCTITPDNNIEFIANYDIGIDVEDYPYGFNKSWVLEYSSTGELIQQSFIQLPGLENQLSVDIDSNSQSNIITTKVSNRSIFLTEGDDGNFGQRASHPHDGKMIPALPPVTHPEYTMAETKITYTGTTAKRGETVFIQNTETDEGIIYYLWSHTVNYVTTLYVTKAVYVEKLDQDERVYAYFSDQEEDGGFRKAIPGELFNQETHRIKLFHVVNDNTFTFLVQNARWFSNSPDTGQGDAWLAIYKYNTHEGEEEPIPTMDRTFLTSLDVVEDFDPDMYVVAHGKCAIVTRTVVGDNTYSLGGIIIDLSTGGFFSAMGLGVISRNSMYTDGTYKPIVGGKGTSCYTQKSPVVLSGHTATLVYINTEGFSKVDRPDPDNPSFIICDCGKNLNSDVYAALGTAYAVEFNLSSNSIRSYQIGNDAIIQIPKISSKEKDYLSHSVYGTNGPYFLVVNQDLVNGVAYLRFNLEFSLTRYLYRYNGGLCLPWFPMCWPVFTFEQGEHYIRSYTFALPGGDIVSEQASLITWTKDTSGPNPGNFVDYPEKFSAVDVREFHYGGYYSHAYQPLFSHKSTPLVADNAGNWTNRGTGTPVFRNGITFEIVAEIEAPFGLGQDLEDRSNTMTWMSYDNYLDIVSNSILVARTHPILGGRLQDEIDNTRYLVIHKKTGSPTSYYSWSTYLVGYDDEGNITKRFYSEYLSRVYDFDTDRILTYIKHSEMRLGNNADTGKPFHLDIQGNILHLEYDARYSPSSHRWETSFIKFYDYTLVELLQDRYLVLRQDLANFEGFTLIQEFTNKLRVDISKEAPTVIYDRVVGSGTSSITRTTYTNEVDDYNFVDINRRIRVHDARTFSVMNENNFYVYSGALSEQAFDYVVVANDTRVRFMETGLEGEWNVLAEIGELVNHIETTNYTDNPYFFISTSGESVPQKFYQRDNDSSVFVEQSAGLPSGAGITIIRCDDRI